MILPSVSTAATTYSFVTEDDERYRSWAICTVNDRTGELLITGDHGNWAYQWSPEPKHLGAPSLTAFIGERGGVHYIADKLQGRRGGVQFSAAATAKELQRELIERRMDAARAPAVLRYGRRARLDRAEARRLWDELDAIAADIGNSFADDDAAASALFFHRWMAVDGYQLVDEEPWEMAVRVQTHADKVLRESILPALVAACRERVRDAAVGQWAEP